MDIPRRRGAAAAATWIFRGAAEPPRRGYAAATGRGQNAGVQHETESAPPKLEDVLERHVEDDVEILEGDADGANHDGVVAAYYADAGKKSERKIVQDPWLGLAIEELPPGVTTKSLWEIPFY